ncbi:hypothetical protein PMZ80_009638 [Knufia obscura]|uniref:Major facilitator superfamily (MFS) profile domain-containing protein n=1 Tax=Knufia obscura TaxID=1635080 RepID=A0ABR0RD67_9EURO|nr:hypothetical protein PMZ80_009638 [Knufia obscura]
MAEPLKYSSEHIDIKKEAIGEVHDVEVNPAGAALAAATEAQKPSLVSPGMLKLWMIISITNTQGQFIGGRFVLGFGASIASAAAPAYVVELAHPSYRGLQAGMYNNFWWLGNILAGWTTYGSDLHLKNSWAWRTPTVVQCIMPSIAMCFIMFFPESPRWLIAHDRREEAVQIFAKYHADGDEHAPIVQLQIGEVIEEMNLYRNENPWWDFKELFNTRAARYRLMMVKPSLQ